MKENKIMKFWEKYGYVFFLLSGVGLLFAGEKLIGLTYILLGASFYRIKI